MKSIHNIKNIKIYFSKGAVDQYNCIYVKPQTGSSQYTFNIVYDQVRNMDRILSFEYDEKQYDGN
jgi:hypothetical protein